MLKIKLKKFNKKTCLSLIALFILNLHTGYASPSDNFKPVNISSDKFEIDYINGHAVYLGNVRLKQGSRFLEADSLYVYFHPNSDIKINNTAENNNLKIKEIKATGSPAKYSEDLLAKEQKIQAQANIMKFTPSTNLVTLQDSATIMQNGKQLTSTLLHYNIKTETAYAPKQKNQRNKLILGNL